MRQVGGFLRVLWFPPPIKLTPRYNWNIVESGVKHHQTNIFRLYCVDTVVDFQWLIYCIILSESIWVILWKYFYLLATIFMVFTKCIDLLVLEFVVSNITGNYKWENCISLDFNFRGLSELRNPLKLEPHMWRLIMISQ